MTETLYTLPKRLADLLDTAEWGINSPFESYYRSLSDMQDSIAEDFDDPFGRWEQDMSISDEEYEAIDSVDPMAMAFYANAKTKHLVEVINYD